MPILRLENSRRPPDKKPFVALVGSTMISTLGWWGLGQQMAPAMAKGLAFGIFMVLVFKYAIYDLEITERERFLRILGMGIMYGLMLGLAEKLLPA